MRVNARRTQFCLCAGLLFICRLARSIRIPPKEQIDHRGRFCRHESPIGAIEPRTSTLLALCRGYSRCAAARPPSTLIEWIWSTGLALILELGQDPRLERM